MLGRWTPGPVFIYEWLVLSRRWQMYALRVILIALLGGALGYVWWARLAGQPLNIRNLAVTGEYFFYGLIGTELSLVLLVAPAYTAGSICLDKARGTLLHLLVTDLSDAELVLGKLAARLVPVVGMVACSVPVLFGAILLGGIGPGAALSATLVTLGTSIFAAALALALSVWGRKVHEVLLVAYLLLALIILAGPMWAVLTWSSILGRQPDWLRYTNPYVVAFLPYLRPGASTLSEPAAFLSVTFTLSVSLMVVAVVRVRAVTLRQANRPARASRTWKILGPWRAFTRSWPGPSLDGNPVLWREWRHRRPSRWARAAWLVYGLVTSLLSFAVMVFVVFQKNPLGPGLSAWVNALQVSIGLILVCVTAGTALAEDRAQGTLELVLATPLPTRAIVWGKWWGAYRPVPLLAVLPAVVAGGLLGRSFRLGSWLALVALVLGQGLAVTSLGLAITTWISRLGRALAVSVTLLVLVTILPFLGLLTTHSREAEWIAVLSPFFGPGQLTAMIEMGQPNEGCTGWAVIWSVTYLAAGMGLFLATLATFNRCLGRITKARP